MADMLVKERPKQRQENVYLKREVSIPFDATYINDALASQPLSAKTLQVSEELYWERYYEGRGEQDESYEWNNGILEEKAMPTLIQLNLYGWFFKLLQTFLETHPIGDLIFLETAFRLSLPNMTHARKPDLFVIHNSNPISFDEQDRSYSGIADLCVEALSDSKPSEVRRDVDEKKLEYSLAGVQEYYILDPSGKHMAFYERTPAGDYQEIQPHRGVIHSNVLPGFQFRLSDLYERRPLIELAEDPVYSSFVLPEYQAQKLLVQHAEEKSARLEEKLRSLGIDPDDI